MKNRLKEVLKEKGVTGYRLSKDLHIHENIAYGYINGLHTPGYDRMLIIANYLKVKVEDIWS